MNAWSNYTVQERQHSQIVEFFVNRRDMRVKERVYSAIQKSRENDQHVQNNFYLQQMFQAFKKQIRRQLVLKSHADQVEFVHSQLTKHVCMRAWRQTLFMALAFNKVAAPFNDTQLYRRAFTALRENGTKNKKARQFHTKALLMKTA